MSAREALTQRMTRAALQLRRELEAAGEAAGVLPEDQIEIVETADGVTVVFLVPPPARKRSRGEENET